jgi:hypothetical protein
MAHPELTGEYHADVNMLMEEIDRLSREKGTAPRGKNRYGLDAHYFYGKLEIINRDIENMTPDEMSRALLRLARVSDSKVLSEGEFKPWVQELAPIPKITDDVMIAANRVIGELTSIKHIGVTGRVVAAIWAVLEGKSVDEAVMRTTDSKASSTTESQKA